MIDACKYAQALCLHLGLESVHRILRPVAAAYSRQSVRGHCLRSPKAHQCGQCEDRTFRLKPRLLCHNASSLSLVLRKRDTAAYSACTCTGAPRLPTVPGTITR